MVLLWTRKNGLVKWRGSRKKWIVGGGGGGGGQVDASIEVFLP